MIKRDFYLNQIIERMWDRNIKVITGIRRGKKSTLFLPYSRNIYFLQV